MKRPKPKQSKRPLSLNQLYGSRFLRHYNIRAGKRGPSANTMLRKVGGK